MGSKAADVLIDILIDWDVDTIFGLPGDGINGIMEALRQRQEQIRFIQARHEESAAFMACGYAKYTSRHGCDLQPIDFAAFARACGGTGFTIEEPSECGPILDEALATPGPVVVQAVVDPFEPPMPPKISVEQAAKFAESLAEGTPNRGRVAWTVLSDKVRE